MKQPTHTHYAIDGDTFWQRAHLVASIPLFVVVELFRWRRTYGDPWPQCIRITLAMARLRLFSHLSNWDPPQAAQETQTEPEQTCTR